MKTELKTYYQTDEEVETFLQSLIKNKEKFKLEMTGYSSAITWRNERFICSGEIDSGKNFQVFSLNKKIKSDIKNSGILLDRDFEHQVKWFGVNRLLEKNKYYFEGKEVYNIDISTAYPSALKRMGFISDETFNSLHFFENKKTGEKTEVKKRTRLKSLGMLATQKTVYYFEKGKEVNSELIENKETRNVFFLLCYEIGNLINSFASQIGKDFIFFWFDGIYFTGKENIKKGVEIINKRGYNCTVDKLYNFSINSDSDLFYLFDFWEFDEKTISMEKKTFNIPMPYRKKSPYIEEYLKKLRHNEIEKGY